MSGINVCKFFSNSAIALPIVHADVDYYRPAFCGDLHEVHLVPEQQSENSFKIYYTIYGAEDKEKERFISKALTRHVCINPITRERQALPNEILQWLERWRIQESSMKD